MEVPSVSLQAILQRIANGEQLAFAELVQMYQRPLFGFLGRMGMAQAQAEDIAQETFLRAWTHLPSFDATQAQFGTWLFTIARNLAYSALQSAAHQREVRWEVKGEDRADVNHDGIGIEAPDAVCPQPGPPQLMMQAQQQAQLQAALRQLPMPERSALALVYVHGLALVDVARIEGDSLPAIKTRLHRAKRRLRALLQTTPGQSTREMTTPPETHDE
jgi:RNA polymerase sigma-70 factor, ECF subfamily